MSYRDDVAALAARHAALEAELAAKTRELAAASELLDEARARTRLPVLDNIRVASPCSAAWAEMTGTERVRHCGACAKQVFNLSEMTRDEAEALIVEAGGKLCVRYYQRADGTILLKDCTIGVARRRRRRILAAGAIALLAGGAALVFRGRESVTAEASRVDLKMGDLAPVTETVRIESPPPAAIEPTAIEVMGDIGVAEPVEVLGGVGREALPSDEPAR